MSFYLSNQTVKPCPIRNAGSGCVCEKVCIEVTKVFDACVSQTQERGVTLAVTGYTPANPTFPLTFVSAECQPGAVISGLVISRLTDRPNFANISYTLTIPVVVNYTDASGVSGTATSTYTVSKSTTLFYPQDAIMPVDVTAFALCTSIRGTYVPDNSFTADFCLYVITKVVGTVDMLVPSYGYTPIPECNEQTICPGLRNLNMFPTAF